MTYLSNNKEFDVAYSKGGFCRQNKMRLPYEYERRRARFWAEMG